jgi:hypothetical protein
MRKLQNEMVALEQNTSYVPGTFDIDEANRIYFKSLWNAKVKRPAGYADQLDDRIFGLGFSMTIINGCNTVKRASDPKSFRRPHSTQQALIDGCRWPILDQSPSALRFHAILLRGQ